MFWGAQNVVLETLEHSYFGKIFFISKKSKMMKFHYRFQEVALKWLTWILGGKSQKWQKS